MIKANELRIGNYVEYRHLNNGVLYRYDTVTNIDLNGISLSCRKYNLITIDCIKPIPLTEDLLLKCGFINEFEDEEDNSYFTLKNIEIQKILFKEEFFLDNVNNISVSIKHLHQLQNLYFVLTGTELEIKL